MDYIIIVAGGKGTRMGADVPKQFLEIAGEPILMRTIRNFHSCNPEMGIVLVLPRDQQDFWKKLCEKHHFQIEVTLADGGDTRFESSKNGIAALPDDANGAVGIHDGVRPFVSHDVIQRCFDIAREKGACIPVLPINETLRQVDENGTWHNVQRADYRIVQTPQCFQIDLLRRAFRQSYDDRFTDDATVVENCGVTIQMTEGNRENIKLTTPYDLLIAETLLKENR